MINKSDFRKINNYLWEIPKGFRADMRVSARIYASEKMLEEIFRDESIRQLINTTTLPGIMDYSLAMPDVHEGYGFCIGGVAATKLPEGVISPGGIGFDQNCGCRLLISGCKESDVRSGLEKLAAEIQKEVPSGLGQGRKIKFSIEQIDSILKGGARYLAENGYGESSDLENCESGGCMAEAQSNAVSSQAKNRGRDQVGTLGSGNHFLEIQKVTEIFDEQSARAFGLFKDQVVIMIHTGSRGLGHQNCTDYLKTMVQVMQKYGIVLPDRELACVPFSSPEGQSFFAAMCAGANYAWANRQMITYYVRKAWQEVLAGGFLSVLYDVAHNIAKVEEHEVGGAKTKLCVHRKGATRAFPPNHPELPVKYKATGQPVIIPGSMGTASYVCVGTEKSKEAWYTVNHGAGRVMSRRAATMAMSGKDLARALEQKGIIVKCHDIKGIAEEAPQAYKDIDEVIEVVHNAGLSKKVARLVPLAVIKGE